MSDVDIIKLSIYVVFFDDKGIKIYLCNSRKTHLEKIFTFLLLDISPLGFRSRAAVVGDVADVASGPLQISQVIFTPLSLCRSLATHAYATLDPCWRASGPIPGPISTLSTDTMNMRGGVSNNVTITAF